MQRIAARVRSEKDEGSETGASTPIRIDNYQIEWMDDFARRFKLWGGRREIVRAAVREFAMRHDPKLGAPEGETPALPSPSPMDEAEMRSRGLRQSVEKRIEEDRQAAAEAEKKR
ncbi:MAG: hypothetical protein QOE90_916 [Thermoplasmata archaeon]|jgi:hypothetical protein|nr:hypothetical protein [Thermoplasmata archaeon]